MAAEACSAPVTLDLRRALTACLSPTTTRESTEYVAQSRILSVQALVFSAKLGIRLGLAQRRHDPLANVHYDGKPLLLKVCTEPTGQGLDRSHMQRRMQLQRLQRSSLNVF